MIRARRTSPHAPRSVRLQGLTPSPPSPFHLHHPPLSALPRERSTGYRVALIASFSRALVEGVSDSQSDEEFNATLGASIDQIYEASTEKVAA